MHHPHLLELRRKVDDFYHRIAGQHARSMACRRGCDACCKVDLSVFPVEAEPIRQALTDLPEDLRKAVAQRRESQEHCLFLVGGECVVYDERPLICRSQGLPLQLEDYSRTACELNFQGEQQPVSLPAVDVLNLATTNLLLSLIHRNDIAQRKLPDERVRLADLL